MQNYTGLEYLKIDVATHFGLDKEDFDVRLKWTDNHIMIGDLHGIVPDADDTFRYVAAVLALEETMEGKPSGHLVGLDASASGIQVLSALTGCPIGAYNTGLTSNRKQDPYMLTTQYMNQELKTSTQWERDVVKPAVMTVFYGSKAEPKKAFGDGTDELGAFYTAVKKVAPGAFDLIPILIDTWDPEKTHHEWPLPDGFRVKNPVLVQTEKRIEVDELDHHSFLFTYDTISPYEGGLANAANITHSVDGFVNRELCRRCNYDANELIRAKEDILHAIAYNRSNDVAQIKYEIYWIDTGFMSLAGVLDMPRNTMRYYTEEYLKEMLLLVESILSKPSFPVISVHDEFKCHPNYMNIVRQTYIEIFAELAESDLLNYILKQLTGKDYNLQKIDPTLGDQIRQGDYALA